MVKPAKNLALNLLLFCCAASAVAVAASTGSDPNTTLAVRTLRGYLMVVSVSINEHGPFDFLIDTGSNTTLIDPELAAELSLKPKDRLRLVSFASATEVPRYYLTALKVGAASLSNLEALALPLPQLTALDNNIRGVLGMNFLLHFSFRLDYERQVLELYPSPEGVRIPAGLRVPVEINESRLLVKVASSASPSGSWQLALDSGISQLLLFQERITPAAAGPCRQDSCLMQVASNLADHSASTVLLNDVSIADARLPDMQVVVLRNDLQKPSDPQDGLLPAAPFRSVFFDRSSVAVIFSPSPGTMSLAALKTH
jgi:predicted aspartyl protease